VSAVDAGALDDLAEGVPGEVKVDGAKVIVVRLGDAVYAIGAICTHQEVDLVDGEVDADECTVECPKHGSQFDLVTGEALCLPATRPVAVYSATVVDGRVVVSEGQQEVA